MPRAWVVQIVAALVLNAIQAVVEAARKAPEIELRVVTTDDVALIEVRDTGVGMSGDVRRHAADPFYTTRRPGAVGLGLTMTAAYVRNVGGELFIESAAGGGTAIKVFVPRIKSAKVRASGSGGTPLN
jgi:C4-dicarboxylate-specific signal transduction histidine kinase